VFHHSSVSLNKEKICHEISEDKIAVCKKTQGLRSGNFSDLNSACSKVLVPVKIFQFHDMHYESERYRDAENGLTLTIQIPWRYLTSASPKLTKLRVRSTSILYMIKHDYKCFE
jgi:hypothetical protein